MDGTKETDHVSLLRPLRDLAQNWNVDLASELEEYLEELASVTFRFGDDKKALNFAQAALLIQGSACVYGKKVEYLHHLVLQALDLITEQRRNRNERLAQLDAHDVNQDQDEDDLFYEEEEVFLNLDDTIVEAEGIDLPEDVEAPRTATPSTRKQVQMWRLEDWSGQRSSAARAAADGSAFRMATCSVHRSGALLLQEEDGNALDEELRPVRNLEVDGLDPEPAHDPPVMAMDAGYDSEDGDAHGLCYPESPHFAPHEEEEEEYDPYQPLQPDDGEALIVKPLRRGRIRFRILQKQVSNQLVPFAKANMPCWPEFGYAFEEIRRREASIKAEERARARQSQRTQLHSLFSNMDGEQLQEEDVEEEDFGAPQGFASDDEDMGGYGEDEEPLSMDQEVNYLATHSSLKIQEAEMSYRELCKQHIEKLLAAAAAAEVQTELAQRVSAWKAKIQPLLDEQEAHGEFDIQEYGDEVLDRLVGLEEGGEEKEIAFERLVEGEQEFEVPRRFVATLQLACDGNVQLEAEDTFDGKASNFRVVLLSQDHHHRQMLKDFQAPSLVEQKQNVLPTKVTEDNGDSPLAKRTARRSSSRAIV